MKKYILMFALTLVMGLFISNTVVAQWTSSGGVSWTNDDVGIGVNTPQAPLHIVHDVLGSVAVQEKVIDSFHGGALIMRKARGTVASKLTPLDNDIIGGLFGLVWNGSAYRPSATIRFFADGDVTSSSTAGKIIFQTQPSGSAVNGTLQDRMIIRENGYVGIGTNDPQSLLAVNGKITSTEVEVTLTGWSDFVFNDDYYLRPLEEVEQFIKTNKHLPDVPSEVEVLESGVNVGEMSATLLQKIEELTLYIIELNKRIEELEK
jgi:hypothetical protein